MFDALDLGAHGVEDDDDDVEFTMEGGEGMSGVKRDEVVEETSIEPYFGADN